MGSRKRKPVTNPNRRKFIAWWLSLSPTQRIAFKATWWHWGRGRVKFIEFFQHAGIINRTAISWAADVEAGYSWLHERDLYRPISYYTSPVKAA